MNSDIDGVSDALQRELLTLLFGDRETADRDAVKSDTSTRSAPGDAGPEGTPNRSIHDLGEIPIVQDRFHTLLKQRLQVEAAQHPPLFPWETELQEYPDDLPALATANPWLAHRTALNLPAVLPEAAFARLLDRCQAIAQTPLQEGLRLVQAVRELFPEPQFPSAERELNELAGWVMRPATRGNAAAADLQLDYDTAQPRQQMALALMAAREIASALILPLSPSGAAVERQWVTAWGPLAVRATCQPAPAVPADSLPGAAADAPLQLDVTCELPCGGSVELHGDRGRAAASCPQAGTVQVASDASLDRTYALTIAFPQAEAAAPLAFTLVLQDGRSRSVSPADSPDA